MSVDQPLRRFFHAFDKLNSQTPATRTNRRPRLGIEAMEHRTMPTAVPIASPDGGIWVKIDTISVAAKTNQTSALGVTSSVTLDAGKTYLAVAHETARISTDSTGFADAEYIRYNKTTGPQDGSSPGYTWVNHGVRLAGVVGGETTGNLWGAYQSDHQYVKNFIGRGTKVTGYFTDIPGYYGDNSGSIAVDIYASGAIGRTTTTLTTSAPTAVYGQSVTLTANVTANSPAIGVPGGTVTFFDGQTILGVGTLSGGTANLTVKLNAGAHAITAVYGGAQLWSGSSSAINQTITPAPLVVVAHDKSKDYGADLPALTYSSTGFVNNDSPGMITGTLTTTATPDSVAGSYPITQGSLSAGSNYAIMFSPGTLTIRPMNIAPAVTTPDILNTAIDTPISFNIGVNDVDAGNNPIQLSWSVSNGTLSLAKTAGLTFSFGDGTNDTEGTATGTLANLNAAFTGATFTPTAGYIGEADVSLNANDLGNTGAGGPKEDFQNTFIVVGPDLQASNDSATTPESTAIAVDVLGNDLWVTKETPTITVLTNPTHGTSIVADGMVYYTPTLYYHGTDSFTYRITDTHGHTSDATASFVVTEVNNAKIDWVGNIYTDEGDLGELQLSVPDAAPGNVTWSASGLPVGQTVDSSTGAISGRPQYGDAQTLNGDYTVTVSTLHENGDSDSLEFHWNVQDVNRWQSIDDQSNVAGKPVNIPFVATDLIGNELTYDVTNLPSGVTYVPGTGFTGTPDPDQITEETTFHVIAHVTGGGGTDERLFNWKVTPESTKHLDIAINDTLRHEDDLGFVGQPLPVAVTLHDNGLSGARSISIRVETPDGQGATVPSGRALISLNADGSGASSQLTLSLYDGVAQEIYLIPLQASDADDDIVLVAYDTPESPVVFQGAPVVGKQAAEALANLPKIGSGAEAGNRENQIYADSTPQAMIDAKRFRIPPTKITPYWVSIPGPLGNKELTVRILNMSEANGTAFQFNPSDNKKYDWITLKNADFVNNVYKGKIYGKIQTAAGPKPNGQPLVMAVFGKNNDANPRNALVKSEGFSVSAIPVKVIQNIFTDRHRALNFNFPFPEKGEVGFRWGSYYKVSLVSDSGGDSQVDLNKSYQSEFVDDKSPLSFETGILKGTESVITNNTYFAASLSLEDRHTLHYHPPGQVAETPGEMTVAEKNEVGLALNRELLEKFNSYPANVLHQNQSVQYFKFFDERTGMSKSDAIPIENSLFIHFREITKSARGGTLELTYKMLTPTLPIGIRGGMRDKDPAPFIKARLDLK